MLKSAIGMLCFARPLHTALTLAYLYKFKRPESDVYAFLGLPASAGHKSPALGRMLVQLQSQGLLEFYYLPEDAERNTGGNVDNLMHTLNAKRDYYDFYLKIDDDVLMGEDAEKNMGELLLEAKEEYGVLVLMGQVVRYHLKQSKPFHWDARLGEFTLVQRTKGASPMETLTAVSFDFLPWLEECGLSTSCENPTGTFGPYSKKLFLNGGRAGLVLHPAINMQHIGLTTTITPGDEARGWAPARSWSPADRVIDVEGFNFERWEKSHDEQTVKQYTIEVIEQLDMPAAPQQIILEAMEAYTPGSFDVPLPPARVRARTPTKQVKPKVATKPRIVHTGAPRKVSVYKKGKR